MTSLYSYLTSFLGLKVSYPKTPSESLIQAQNSSFAKDYNFKEILLSGHKVIVAERNKWENMNGTTVAKEYTSMMQYFSFILLLELPIIDSVFRRQLISKKVNFVVPGHQLYFPDMFIVVKEDRGLKKGVKERKLSISAQVLLLYHLQKKSVAGYSFKEIAEMIGYSQKTVSLIVGELTNFGIAKVVSRHDRSKTIQFYKRGLDLYNYIEKWLQSPVIDSGSTNTVIEGLNLPLTGYGARLFYNQGSNQNYIEYAISSKMAKETKLKLYRSGKKYDVEIWKYDPTLLATDGYVDVLSLILSSIKIYYGQENRSDYRYVKGLLIDKVKWADME